MSREELLAFAARVESATGADREIDLHISLALRVVDQRTDVGGVTGFGYVDRNQWSCEQVAYLTASLDAVLALCAEKLPGWTWNLSRVWMCGRYAYTASLDDLDDATQTFGPTALAATPALAFLAVFLRALAATAASGGGEGVS